MAGPPIIPRTYIYHYYNIDPTEGSYVQKYVQKAVFLSFKTIFGPTGIYKFSDNPRAYVRQAYFSNILYAPNVANLGFWKI